MKLSEILRVPQHNNKRYNISSFDLKNKEKMGHSEGSLVIYRMTNMTDRNLILYGLYDKNILLSSIIGVFFSLDGMNTFAIKDAFTPIEYQKKGYATALYSYLVKYLNLKLLSDAEQTPNGERLWNSIRKVLPVKIYDTATRKIVDPGNVPDKEIYTFDADKNRYLFIVESWLLEDIVGIPRIHEGLLEKYLFYTHSSNQGKYE